MKKIYRWLKSGKQHKYINGGKGVISIFLAAIMLPFLTMADFLVESARYHDAVAVLDSSMDSAGLSTLSYYDDYLLDRFGLMAVSQDQEMKDIYEDYLKDNLDSYVSWDISNVTVTGDLALSDTDILMQEIAEISKFSAPTALAGDYLISELISMLKNLDGVDIFEQWADVFASAGDALDSQLTLWNNLADFKNCAKKLSEAMTKYDEKHKKFEDAIEKFSEVVRNLNEAKEKEAEGSDNENINGQIQVLEFFKNYRRHELTNAKKRYSEAIQNLINELGAYKTSAEKVANSIAEIRNSAFSMAESIADVRQYGLGDNKKKLEDSKNTIEDALKKADGEEKTRLEKQKKDLEIQLEECKNSISNMKTTESTVDNTVKKYADELQKNMDNYQGTKIDNMIYQLNVFQSNLTEFRVDSVTEDFMYFSSYYYKKMSVIITEATIKSMIHTLEAQATGEATDGGSIWGIMNAMSSIFRSLFTVNGVYDSRLEAYLAEGLTGYEESTIDLILSDISSLMNEVKDVFSLTGFVTILMKLKNIITIFVQLFQHIGQYLLELLLNVTALIQELSNGNIGDKVLLDEYIVKSLPNRTSITSTGSITGKAAFTGYSFSSIALKPPKSVDLAIIPAADSISTLMNMIKNVSSGGSDKMFTAAEVEYIIAGSRSEIVNQSVVFMNLYLMRLILNFRAVLGNAEVQAIAASVAAATLGIGEPIVKAFYLLVEPLLDTVFLVNGKEVPLYKTGVYLSPTGMRVFIDNITSLKIANTE